MEKILLGSGDNKGIRVAKMVHVYVIYFKKIMGNLQYKEIQEGRGDILPDGQLCTILAVS